MSESGVPARGVTPRVGLIRLSELDNVLISAADLEPGVHATADGETVEVVDRVALGHKVAARAIADGERIVRGGMPIGSATSTIPVGRWVHTHNLRSDYLPTFAQRGGRT